MSSARRKQSVFFLAFLAFRAGALGAALAVAPASAQAREPEPAPAAAPVIVAPVVKKDDGASYPPQAITDKVKATITVTVIVEVDDAGIVEDAKVQAPMGHGFDEAAIEAALKLEFAPATRNGKPVAAKILHKYVFAPPTSRLVGHVSTERGSRDAPVEGATITLTGNGETHAAKAGADGSYRVDDLPAGNYHVVVAASGYAAQEYDEELGAGEEAKIDLRLTVTPPAKEEKKPGEPDVQEVEVKGDRPPREVTKRTLEQRELTRIPGTNGDALRAIQNLPGVARPPAIAGLLIVRGAAPNETNVYVDGSLIPIVYHFGGLSSVIPTEMIEKLDFYPGNFSAYYGRVTGAIVDVGVKSPRVDADKKIHGLAQVDLIDARVLAEGPIANTGWKFSVAGRRSYLDTWLKPVLEKAGAGVTTAPVYYDYQAMLQKDWDGGRQSLRFFFFGSDDRLAIISKTVNGSAPAATGDITLGTAFYRFQARYLAKLGKDTEVRLTAAVGKDAIDFSIGDNFFKLTTYPINPRFELSQKLGFGIRNNVGLDMYYAPYTVDLRLPQPPRPGQPPAGPFGSKPPREVSTSDAVYQPAIYDELELTPFAGTRIVPGVRLDYTKDTKAWDVQPRVVVRQDVTKEFPRTTLKGGIGRFTQPPQPQETNNVFGMAGLTSNVANHYGGGIEQEITRQIEVSLEGFYRQYDRRVVQSLGNVGQGRAFGLETLLRYKPDDRFFGFLAYTLSRSERKDGPGEPERLFPFDQTHILTLVGSYRLGKGWEIGARMRYVSGSLVTPLTYGFYDATIGSYVALNGYPPNTQRNPPFHQLDVRIDKSWQVTRDFKFAVYLDIYNAYNAGSVEGVSYNYNYTQSVNATGIPFLPSIGMRGEL